MQEMQVQSLGQESPLEKECNPLQRSCLENSMDRGAWRAKVHGVAKNQTQLSTHILLAEVKVKGFINRSVVSDSLQPHGL